MVKNVSFPATTQDIEAPINTNDTNLANQNNFCCQAYCFTLGLQFGVLCTKPQKFSQNGHQIESVKKSPIFKIIASILGDIFCVVNSCLPSRLVTFQQRHVKSHRNFDNHDILSRLAQFPTPNFQLLLCQNFERLKFL